MPCAITGYDGQDQDDRTVQLRSRNNNDFASRYPLLPKALAAMPDETLLDGEVVALDASGRPSFNTLQNYSSPTIIYDTRVSKHYVMTRKPAP